MQTRLPQSKNLLYVYDLPRDGYTSVSLAKIIKEKTGYDLDRIPQVRRDLNKPFYQAVIQINDESRLREVAKALRYFNIQGKPCRALPFTNELLGTNVTKLGGQNIFVRKVDKHCYGEEFEKVFSQFGEILSCKVSLNEDHSSRGYGFVCFKDASAASSALSQTAENEQFVAVKFAPRDKKEFRKVYNNVYVKNLPPQWGEEDVRKCFGAYGHITSVYMTAHANGPYAFVCYEAQDPADHEYGPRCAERAVTELNDKEFHGFKLYVRPGLKKGERERELEHETFKYKNSKKRCNLYVKGFPATMNEQDLQALFSKYGDIESLKLFPQKDQKQPFAFVCFKTPDQASNAKTQLSTHQIDNHPLYINHYEIKQYRDMQNEMQKDKQDFQRYQAENSGGLHEMQNSDEIMNLLRLLLQQGYLKRMNQPNQGGPGGPRGFQGGQPGAQGGHMVHPGQTPNMGGHPNGGQQHRQGYNQRQNNGQHQNNYQKSHMGQAPGNVSQGMPPAQSMPNAMPNAMPAAMNQAPQPMSMPPVSTNMGTNPKDEVQVAYLAKTMPILPAILSENPNYQQHVGSCIFPYVQSVCGPDLAPKITGMLIDLPITEIHAFMKDYYVMVERIRQAKDLLEQQSR